MKQFRLALLALFAVLCAAPALAQSYPARPIRLVVPFGAGGGTDNLARIIEPLVTKALGQPLVIENRPGGGSTIGMDQVAKAAPDGYTLVMTDTSIAVNPSLKPLPYDTINDFMAVSLLATASMPITLPPPGRFSITIGWPSALLTCGSMMRARLSVPPPAPNGTTRRIARVGYDCAKAGATHAQITAATQNDSFSRMTILLTTDAMLSFGFPRQQQITGCTSASLRRNHRVSSPNRRSNRSAIASHA